MKRNCVSIGKIGEQSTNEDAALGKESVVAVSDGAGGGEVYAERWSGYLLDNLPDKPIVSFGQLDEWIARIWKPFYNQCEADARQIGGLLLDKFYDEGSFATLVAVWRESETLCRWMSFGDSVAFHYNYATRQLQHSFGALADFDKPPYLINCKDELLPDGFRCGTFTTDSKSVVFVATDALAHYILMMYEAAGSERYSSELCSAAANGSKNGNYINVATSLGKIDFEKRVLSKLVNCTGHEHNFRRHIRSLIRRGLIARDDYSLAMLDCRERRLQSSKKIRVNPYGN